MKDILDLCRLNLMEEHVEDSTALAAIDIARRRAVTRIEPPEVTQEMMDRHHEENTADDGVYPWTESPQFCSREILVPAATDKKQAK